MLGNGDVCNVRNVCWQIMRAMPLAPKNRSPKAIIVSITRLQMLKTHMVNVNVNCQHN